MSAAPWTPGPWEVNRVPGSVAYHVGPRSYPNLVYLSWTERQSADARLIAAAPEMAALLERVASGHLPDHIGQTVAARALLARIRGEAP